MRLVEFVLRGVRRFEGGRKLAFHEGYNLVSGPNESGKSLCLLALLATLEPDRLEGRLRDLVPESPAGAEPVPARCGLTFLHDGKTYRIVRDLEQGAANLSTLDAASGKYVPQQREADGVRQWLREAAGMPGRGAFDALFVLDRAAMPSTALHAWARAGGSADGSGRPERVFSATAAVELSAPPPPVLTGAAREARIAEVKAELARVEEMGKLEFRLDGAKAKLFEIEAEFGEARKLDQLAADLAEAIGEFEALGVDPEQLETRARSFKTLAEKRAADLAAVEAEREALEMVAASPVTPIVQDPLVLGGAAGTVVFLIAGFWAPAAAAGALAGIGLAGFGALRDAQAAAKQKAAREGLGALDDRVQTIEKKFEIETKFVRTAQETLGVAGPEGILERVEAYRTLKKRQEAVAERREALARQKNLASLEAERQRYAAEVATLEEELRGFGGTAAFDAGELRRELAVLEGRARPERAAAPATAMLDLGAGDEGGGSAGPSAGGAPAGGGPLAEALEAWLEAAARLLGQTRDALARDLLLRAQPIVAPLTGDRYGSLAFDGDDQLVGVAPDGQTTPLAVCSPGTQDAVYFALRAAGHTMIARARPWPLFLDDPLVMLDDTRLQNACRVLKRVAQAGGQVIHLAARKLPPALADSAQTLP